MSLEAPERNTVEETGRTAGPYVMATSTLEACWVTALVIAPLFFNLLSHRIFEPDKTALIRTLGLVVVLAGSVMLISRYEHQRRAGLIALRHRLRKFIASSSGPIVILAMIMVISELLSTIFSVHPRQSFFGSYTRSQGWYTSAAYLCLFFAVLASLRSRESAERFLTVALLASLPVSLYGIQQHFGGDPIPWMERVDVRVPSTMGNPIFVAAYLVMTIPLCLYRMVSLWREALRRESRSTMTVLVVGSAASFIVQIAAWTTGLTAGTVSALVVVAAWFANARLLRRPVAPLVSLALYSVLLSAQSICLFFTKSRGPSLAFMLSVGLLSILWLLIQRDQKKGAVAIACSMLLLIGLLFINLHGPTKRSFRQLPIVERLASILEMSGGSSEVRLLVWRGVLDAAGARTHRAFIGYGPETMKPVFPTFYPPDLAHLEGRRAMPDRAHNETLDRLYSTGLVGLAVYFLFILFIFSRGLQWIGLMESTHHGAVFWSLCLAGAASVPVAFRFLVGDWRLVGLGVPIGLLAGIAAYLIYHTFERGIRQPSVADDPIVSGDRLIIAALLSILVAHFFEVQFGIAVVATRVYFWLYLGLFLVLGARLLRRSHDAQKSPGQPNPPARFWADCLIAGLIVLTLVYDFQISAKGMFSAPAGTAWALCFTWVFIWALLLFRHNLVARGPLHLWRMSYGYIVISAAPAAGFLLLRETLPALWTSPGMPFALYLAAVAGVMIAFVYCNAERKPQLLSTRPVRVLIAAEVFVLLAFVGWQTSIRGIIADMEYRTIFSNGHSETDIEFVFQRTSRLAPHEDFYFLEQARLLVEVARRATSDALRSARLHQAERALLTARTLNPLEPDHAANLARLYKYWSEVDDSSSNQTKQLESSVRYFEEAILQSPNVAHLRNEMAQALLAKGDTVNALEQLEKSVQLDDQFGNTYTMMGMISEAQGRFADAVMHYQRAAEITGDPDAAQHVMRLRLKTP